MKLHLLSRILTVAAVLFMGLSAYSYRPGQTADLVWGDTFMLVGGASLLIALWQHQRSSTHSDTPSSVIRIAPIAVHRHHKIAIGVGIVCLILLAQANTTYPDFLPFAYKMHHAHQFGLFWLGILLVSWGLMGGLPHWRTLNLACSRDVLMLVGIMILGFIIRLILLESSVHLFLDETHFADPVTQLWKYPEVQILTPLNAIASFTWIYPYFQKYTTDLLGPNLAGLRLTSVIIGTLGIPALYFLARQLLNKHTALLAAFLLAVFPPHMHFSRLGLNNIADPLFGTLSFACLTYALRHASRRAYVLSGLCLGLTQYFYEGGRLLFPSVTILWLGWMAISHKRLGHESPLDNQRGYQDSQWRRHIAILAVSALLVAMPYLYLVAHGDVYYMPRLSLQGVGDDYLTQLLASANGVTQVQSYIRDRLNPSYLHLIHTPDGSNFYFGGATGLIQPLWVPFFLLGIFHATWRWRRGGALLLLWVGLTILGNSLIIYNTWTARFVVVLPALCLLIAIGITGTIRLLVGEAHQPRGPVWQMFRALCILTIGGLGLWQVADYFGPYLTLYNQQIRPFYDHQDAGFRTMDLPDTTWAYLLTEELVYVPHIDTMARLTHDPNRLRILPPYNFPFDRVDIIFDQADLAFFIVPTDSRTRHQIENAFRRKLDGPYFSPYNVPIDKQYALYLLPQE